MAESGVDAREFVTTPKYIGSVKFLAEDIRSLELRIGRKPEPDNDHHGEVWGKEERPNYFSKGQKNGLAKKAEWFVELTEVELV